MSRGRRVSLACAAAALALALPASATAKVTIGEDTSADPGTGVTCSLACTLAQLEHPTRAIAVPFDGVLVGWRIRTTGAPGVLRLRIVRPSGGSWIGAGTGAAENVVPGGERAFKAQLPVQAGDRIGVDHPGDTGIGIAARFMVGGAESAVWEPPLADFGMPRAPDTGEEALLLNADIEPDCDRDGLGDESQDFDQLSCNPPRCAGLQPTIVGSLGPDVINGTAGPDVILASIGDDRVNAGAGNDTVCGGKNKDRLAGGSGKDRLFGELGKDVLLGERGRDRLKGQGGRDKCKGGPGRDRGSSCERSRSVEKLRSLS